MKLLKWLMEFLIVLFEQKFTVKTDLKNEIN